METEQLPPKNQNIILKTILPFQMIGEEDAIFGRVHSTTVKCKSVKASVFCIDANEFLNKFSKDPKTWAIVSGSVESKDHETIK